MESLSSLAEVYLQEKGKGGEGGREVSSRGGKMSSEGSTEMRAGRGGGKIGG